MDITADTLVADIAAHHPRSIEVFERHGIDFCCGGRRPLGETCREHGVAVEDVAGEIAAAAAREVPEDRVVTDASLGALVDHIVSRDDTALREDLPRLGRMDDKVAEVHGSRHPELREVGGRLPGAECRTLTSPRGRGGAASSYEETSRAGRPI